MGKKAMIRGADIGSSLINLIKRFETDDIGSFEVSLMEYYEQEYQKLINAAKDMQAVLLTDKVQTLRFIVNECKTVSELLGKIQMLFSDTNTGVIFSSVHRAKGLEADNVYILRPDLMPHPKAKKDYEKQQEMNGKYVAQTRSKNKLIFVKGGENV
jgi:superfamily I DNA/RNA helicase